ncbi:MAG: cytochrome c biogenesis protein CcdA, partial [Gemmatimonadales bacterium]
ADLFRVLGPPETFLVDREGVVVRHWRGQMDPTETANRASILGALGLGPRSGAAAAAVPTAGLLVAFGAGLISVLSPCVLPLVPSYASVVAGVSMGRARKRGLIGAPAAGGGAGSGAVAVGQVAPTTDRGTALRAGLCFVAGFSTVFMALGILVNRAGAALADQRVWLTRAGGVVLVVLGLHLIGVFRIRAAEREVKFLGMGGGRAGYLGAFLVGVAFAAGWSPCVGPVLAGILTFAASGGSSVDSAVLLGAYSAGLAVPFLLAALSLDRFLVWSGRLRNSWLPVAERVSGALVLTVGVLLFTGVFTRLAGWLARSAPWLG